MALFRNEIPDMQIPVCEDCLKELESNFIHTFHYTDRIMIRTHTDAGVQLTFSVQEFEDFEMNLFAWLRHDLDGYQERYNDRSEYAYADALEDLHSVIDILLPY